MAERHPRGPYAKTAERRRQILAAARASFIEHGYDDSSLRDVAVRAGLTHAGVVHHFATKEALLAALLEQRDAEEYARATSPPAADCTAEESAPSTARGARHGLNDLLREHQRDPELMRLWAELAVASSRAGHPAHDYFVNRYARAREVFTERLGAGQIGGPLQPGIAAAQAAVLFIAVLDGLQTQWLLDPSTDITGALDVFRALLTLPMTP